MKTSFGMKHRPEFEVLEWRQWGGGGSAVSGPQTPQLSGPASGSPPDTAPAPQAAKAPGEQTIAGMQSVKPVSAAEYRRRRNPVVNPTNCEGRKCPSPSSCENRVMPDLFWDIETALRRQPAPGRRVELCGASDDRSPLPLLRRRRRRGADLDQPALARSQRPRRPGPGAVPCGGARPEELAPDRAQLRIRARRARAHPHSAARIPRHPARDAALLDGGGPGECLPGRA